MKDDVRACQVNEEQAETCPVGDQLVVGFQMNHSRLPYCGFNT